MKKWGNKIEKIWLFCMVLSLLGSSLVYGNQLEDLQGEGKIRLYKVINDGASVSFETEDEFLSFKMKPVVGSPIALYRVTEGTKETWDKKTEKELGQPFRQEITDQDGKIEFTNLADGTYYLRDLSKEGYRALSVWVVIPQEVQGIAQREIVLYLKSQKPPTPPTPPGRVFLKIDKEGKKPLEGAGFKVYRTVKKDGKEVLEPVMKNQKEYVLYTGKDGKIVVEGLEYGKYALVETVAPVQNGVKYLLLSERIDFEITKDSGSLPPIIIENAPGEPPTPPTPPTTPPDKPPTPPSNPNKPPSIPPKSNIPTKPATPSKVSPSSVKIPKTGDVQVFLYTIGGTALFLLGMYHYKTAIEERKKLWKRP